MPDKPFIPGDDKVAPAITGGLATPADQVARQRDFVEKKPHGTGEKSEPQVQPKVPSVGCARILKHLQNAAAYTLANQSAVAHRELRVGGPTREHDQRDRQAHTSARAHHPRPRRSGRFGEML